MPRVVEGGRGRVPDGTWEIIPPGAETLDAGFPVGRGNNVAGGIGAGVAA
jgi:hypothetical protein